MHRIKPDLLKRLIKSTTSIEPLKPPSPATNWMIICLISLQDRDRSQLYYCDIMRILLWVVESTIIKLAPSLRSTFFGLASPHNDGG